MDFLKSKPRDFFRTALAFTPTVHGDIYPSIDPTRPELSLAGKVVIVTGASKGIGALGISPAVAKAGVKALVLVARSIEGLKETELQIRKINAHVDAVSFSVDISDVHAVGNFFQQVKTKFDHADILVNNTAVNTNHGPLIGDQDPDLWWRDFEINVKGQFLMTRQFISQVPDGARATIVNITTAAATLSKLAALQMTPFVAESYPNIAAVAVHPGMLNTDIVPEEAREIHKYCNSETPGLVGGFVVWLSHPHAHFLTRRFVSAQWDVDELCGRKDEITNTWRKLQLDMCGQFGMEQSPKS
ncbi:uncharacterized protein PG986_013994 [Apiospora aurea]|uniref:NAD(P)-binding protein n=1 Tax=Apiospora aurea TaxID=335848 RepID=A0ABR1PX52_9PEZI